MTHILDDIVALATPTGHGALAVVRISGSKALTIASHFFDKPGKILRSPSHKALHGIFLDENNEELDEVVCTIFRQPHSYTGEDVVEISCHGNPQIANRVLGVLLKHARLAQPGEFTLRAFLNGRISLSQAEAVDDLINARTPLSGKAALAQLQGKLYQWITPLLEMIGNLRIRFEMAIDFADQDLPPLNVDVAEEEFALIVQKMQQALTEGKSGKFIREGIRICLTGAVNVGKSSLFNAFLQEDRAIVTPHPGTTRDYLEEMVSLSGYPAVIYDTAGIRDTDDVIENIGISHSRQIVDNADIILHVFDPGGFPESVTRSDDPRCILVLNKCDLLGFTAIPDEDTWHNYIQSEYNTHISGATERKASIYGSPVPSSTILDRGLDPLIAAILNKLALPMERKDSPLITNTRHLNAIGNAVDVVQNAWQTHRDGLGYELVALDLMRAADHLGEIVGIVTTDDMLNRIFSNFCIGK